MRKCILILILSIMFTSTYGQNESDHLARLKAYEDTLKILADSIVKGGDEYTRRNACHVFIPMLVKALKIDGSFEFPFDSLITISKITSPDKKFRIFTWQLLKSNGSFRFYGTIFMNSPKKFMLFPLFDNSPFMVFPQDTIVNNEGWYGCMYYNIVKVKKYYMLFGWDGNNLSSNKKLIEVLRLNKKSGPVFGAEIFDFGADSLKTRIIIEYKKGAAVGLNYDQELKQIIYDNLIPEEGNAGDKSTYIPDGTYRGFKFSKGKWKHISKVFHYSIGEFDKPPVPNPKFQQN